MLLFNFILKSNFIIFFYWIEQSEIKLNQTDSTVAVFWTFFFVFRIVACYNLVTPKFNLL